MGNIAALLQHQPRIELTYAVNVKSLLGQLDVAVVGYGHAEGCGRSGECFGPFNEPKNPAGKQHFVVEKKLFEELKPELAIRVLHCLILYFLINRMVFGLPLL